MEEIKPDGGQLAGRQNVCCSLVVASWLAANLSVIHFVISAEATRGFEASRLQEHDFMQLESLWPWVYNMGCFGPPLGRFLVALAPLWSYELDGAQKTKMLKPEWFF